MGAEPKVCLNLVSFPSKKLPAEDLNNIIAGALSKITEAGAVLAGGHSIEDDEPKFGLSVIGTVHPSDYWTNGGAQEGDALVLTKALGSGVLFNANLKRWVSAEAMDSCIQTLIQLNKEAAAVMKNFDIHAVTDVTGFGLAGHALEMAKSSGAGLQIALDDLPVMDEAFAMYQKGMNTGVNKYNERLVSEYLSFKVEYPDWRRQIIYDPQTSGGLLAALPGNQAPELVKALRKAATPAAAIIGNVISADGTVSLVIN